MTAAMIERPSPNWNARRGGRVADMVILHYTGMKSAEAAIERLCDPTAQVSSHYLIDRDGALVRMVPEEARAWHAGASSWHGETDINSRSIGIELVNPGHAHGYVDFPEPQMRGLLGLLEALYSRHDIVPRQLLAHSDIAPGRKQDPGERFDWHRLWREGFGLWAPPAPASGAPVLASGDAGPEVAELQRVFADFGYGLAATGCYDTATEQVITAFQRHWRPLRVDGRADASTLDTLTRLHAVGLA